MAYSVIGKWILILFRVNGFASKRVWLPLPLGDVTVNLIYKKVVLWLYLRDFLRDIKLSLDL